MVHFKRAVCFIIDYGLFIALSYLYAMTFGKSTGTHAYTVSGIYSFIPLLYWLLYFPVAEGLFGMTLTKFALSIKVTSVEGSKLLGVKRAFIRRVFDAVDLPLLLIPAIISMSRSPIAQRIGDRVAGSVVTGS
ncbi:MAG: RDD family protein [Bacteroidetes bacterium]|nr:RDD family protein [Bacteroidota bacterium]